MELLNANRLHAGHHQFHWIDFMLGGAWDHEGPGGSSAPEGYYGRYGTYKDIGIVSHLHPHELYLQVWLGLVQ